MTTTFKKIYPYLHLYVSYQGWIAIGADHHYTSWIRILDEGGLHVEYDQETLEESLAEAEVWAKEFMTDNYAAEVKKAGLSS
jgi:hypothetical protein